MLRHLQRRRPRGLRPLPRRRHGQQLAVAHRHVAAVGHAGTEGEFRRQDRGGAARERRLGRLSRDRREQRRQQEAADVPEESEGTAETLEVFGRSAANCSGLRQQTVHYEAIWADLQQRLPKVKSRAADNCKSTLGGDWAGTGDCDHNGFHFCDSADSRCCCSCACRSPRSRRSAASDSCSARTLPAASRRT